jgi:hypothetical protein
VEATRRGSRRRFLADREVRPFDEPASVGRLAFEAEKRERLPVEPSRFGEARDADSDVVDHVAPTYNREARIATPSAMRSGDS